MGPQAKSYPGRSLRRTWRINPVTRVHDNDIRKRRKTERQALKKRLAEEINDSRQPFPLAFLAH